MLQCSEVWGSNDEVERAVSMPGLDAWVLSKPHEGDIAGGDIHYLSSCATGRIGRVLIADVAGHGEKVATLAVRLRNLMRRYVNYVDQTTLVEQINNEFSKVSEPGRFATAVVATFWGPSGDLDLTIAGHPPPLVYRDKLRAWMFVKPESSAEAELEDIPLGVLDATKYRRQKLRLSPRDAVLLYTDALIEARNARGDFLTERGLLSMLNSLSAPIGDGYVLAAYERLRQFTEGKPPDDDATLMLLKLNTIARPKGGLLLAIGAGWRLTREFFVVIGEKLRGKQGQFAVPEMRKDNFFGVLFDRFNRR